MAIESDHKENIWIGTDGGGITKHNPETNTFLTLQHNISDKNSLSSNRV